MTARPITINNLPELDRALARLPPKVDRKLSQQALERAAKHLAQRIQEQAPVDTGTLQKSIRARKSRGGWVVGVSGKQMRKGKWMEYGTENMQPRPFFWRPAFAFMPEAARMMQQDAKELLKQMGGGAR